MSILQLLIILPPTHILSEHHHCRNFQQHLCHPHNHFQNSKQTIICALSMILLYTIVFYPTHQRWDQGKNQESKQKESNKESKRMKCSFFLLCENSEVLEGKVPSPESLPLCKPQGIDICILNPYVSRISYHCTHSKFHRQNVVNVNLPHFW